MESKTVFPPQQYIPIQMVVEKPTTASELLWLVYQFDVTHRKRYQTAKNPKTGKWDTYCNIFVQDFTTVVYTRLGIPHWTYKDGKRTELGALDSIHWLREEGSAIGWDPIDYNEARTSTNSGKVVVVTWTNPDTNHSSHMAIVLPSIDSEEILIAQAGQVNLFGGKLSQGFGNASPLEFWTLRD
jgi:hypothetical protein